MPCKISIEVRKAQLLDLNEVYCLLHQFVVSYQPLREKFGVQFPRLIDSKDACFLVADGDGIDGYALALCIPTLYANGDLWELHELMVAPERRTQGIGARPLEAANYYKLKLT
jgi:GNAT superfamily N-acetyltransferase